jgi:protein-S-isoprenylcysteine O-methyltransferase Ste14
MRRRLAIGALVLAAALAAPAAALAHDAPESNQSKWVMGDWMMWTFFIFAGAAFIGFLIAWRAGHFQDLERHAQIPLLIHEEDYYTPAWALDEEEWDDVHADR